MWPSRCAQLYRFKMAPGYPGIHGLLRSVLNQPFLTSLQHHRKAGSNGSLANKAPKLLCVILKSKLKKKKKKKKKKEKTFRPNRRRESFWGTFSFFFFCPRGFITLRTVPRVMKPRRQNVSPITFVSPAFVLVFSKSSEKILVVITTCSEDAIAGRSWKKVEKVGIDPAAAAPSQPALPRC